MWRLAVVVGLGSVLALTEPAQSATAQFIGRVVVQWVDGEKGADRAMVLMEPFGFRDADGRAWMVPKGTKIDGASIPRAFWTVVGSPFTGDYRRASVVHDHYCVTKERPWQAVHRMFYDAVLAGGVPEAQAKVLYAAVYGGGPRWAPIAGAEPGQDQFITVTPDLSEEEMRQLAQWIQEEDPDLASVERKVQEVVTQ
ncbi:MAG TPA: DUF1353 domain-containing protein [Thermoanaerobaculia bacterium]|nr:DUF1353 domain-containing protein [Thermoanaerobaculia bacterium]